MQPRLVLLEPPAAQREFKLNLPTTIGRSREAKLKLVHGQVSRVHCEFFERDGLLYVRDLGSTNGTFVGQSRIHEAPVWPGDTVTIGAVKFQAMYEPAEERLLPPGAFAATDTIRKASEATYHAAKKDPARDASDTTSATLAAAATPKPAPTEAQSAPSPPPATASAAPPEPEQTEGSFEWFDDLTADQAEAPAPPHLTGGAQRERTESPTISMQKRESSEPIELAPLQIEDAQHTLLPLEEAHLPQLDEAVAADDSLNILPPQIDPAAKQTEAPPELEWRVPEPTSPVEADFAFHVEEPARESQPLPTSGPPKEPAKTDDEDLEEFFKTLDLGGEG